MTMVISLGTRVDMHMRARLENGVLRNGQQPGSVENNSFDHSKFEAMKSLSGWEATRSDRHQFCAIVVFELSSFNKWSEQRKKNTTNGTFAITHFWV